MATEPIEGMPNAINVRDRHDLITRQPLNYASRGAFVCRSNANPIVHALSVRSLAFRAWMSRSGGIH
jgi:hypothetical protein